MIEEIQAAHATGRPILVGTVSVEESERLAARLVASGALRRAERAERRGRSARHRIGRRARGGDDLNEHGGTGTDIRLGEPGTVPTIPVAPGSLDPGAFDGLYVIGTNRHESERVDLQPAAARGAREIPGIHGSSSRWRIRSWCSSAFSPCWRPLRGGRQRRADHQSNRHRRSGARSGSWTSRTSRSGAPWPATPRCSRTSAAR